jgi:biopolymer transport protein TolR
MGMSAGPSGGIKSEINVTPLVDVVLVLLIIFMVVTPMLQRGKDVTLPKSKQTSSSKPNDPLILSVTPDKKMYLEKDEYDADGLQKKLKAELQYNGTKPILVKGDSSLTFGDVRKVLSLANKAGAKSVNLGVEQLKE